MSPQPMFPKHLPTPPPAPKFIESTTRVERSSESAPADSQSEDKERDMFSIAFVWSILTLTCRMFPNCLTSYFMRRTSSIIIRFFLLVRFSDLYPTLKEIRLSLYCRPPGVSFTVSLTVDKSSMFSNLDLREAGYQSVSAMFYSLLFMTTPTSYFSCRAK